MRNLLINLIRKRSRRSTRRKRRSTFSSIANERVYSKIIINYAVIFTKIKILFAACFACALALNDLSKARENLCRFAFRMQIAEHLVHAESATGNAYVDSMHRLHRMPLENVGINDFQKNNYCENTTRFTKDELRGFVSRLDLSETIHVPLIGSLDFYHLNREELLICIATKSALGLTRTAMAEKIFGRDSRC